MTKQEELILDNKQVLRKVKRIAFQIYENNHEESEIVFSAIYDRGVQLAYLLKEALGEIAPEIVITIIQITLDKSNPLSYGITLDKPVDLMEGKVVILVDDVLNSGKAMSYGLKALLDAKVKKIETAVLVNRSHKLYPISAKYKGYELATTITEHVKVNLVAPFSVHLV